jgi:Ca2+-binding RTX toxin-like protein
VPLDLATISARIRINANVAGDQTGARMYVSPDNDLLITWNGNNAIAFDATGAVLPTPAGTWTGAENWLGDTGLIGQAYGGTWFAAVYDGTTLVEGPEMVRPVPSSSFQPAFIDMLPNGNLVFLAHGGSALAPYLVTTTASLDFVSSGVLSVDIGNGDIRSGIVQDFDVLSNGTILARLAGHVGLYGPSGGPVAGIRSDAFTVLSDGGFLSVAGAQSRFYDGNGVARTAAFTVTTSQTAAGIEVIEVDSRLSLVAWYDTALDETRGLLVETSGRVVSSAFSLGAGERHDFAALDADTIVSIESTTDSGPGGAGLDIVRTEFTLDRANIQLGTGADEQFGSAGGQAMAGFGGNDWYYVDSNDDYVVELAGEGTADRIFTSVSLTLRADQEIEIITPDFYVGTTPLSLTGNAFVQTIYGNDGANNLNGGGGADTLFGLGGNDNFFVDTAGDIVRESAGGGSDRVVASTSWVMTGGQEIEKLQTSSNVGTAAINLTGNAFAQAIYGNAGANLLNGGGGIDTLAYDTLAGLLGDDTYIVNNLDDHVAEAAGEGVDRVFANTTWYIRPGQEVEYIAAASPGSTAQLSLAGNEFTLRITGNNGANALTGGGGTAVLEGLGGNDTYWVSTPWVSNLTNSVLEAAGGGNDEVITFLSYALTAGQEIERLTAIQYYYTTPISLTGNAFTQTITGNWGDNQINGGGGGDILIGLRGNDTYFIVNAADQIQEVANGGTDDRAYASLDYALTAGTQVERLSTANHGGVEAIDLKGNALAQAIYGNAGENILNGGGGKDVLVGMGGDDTFLFDTALNTAFTASFGALAATANVARIDGMAAGDRIALDGSLFGLTPGALPQEAFAFGTVATEADDRILWDSATGAILFDSDGAGGAAAQLMAYISNPFSLDYFFFEVI